MWLSSEDTGAYGRDISSSIAELLQRCVAVLPADGRTMLRLGMTNPPFILEHLEAVAEVRGSAVLCCTYVRECCVATSPGFMSRMFDVPAPRCRGRGERKCCVMMYCPISIQHRRLQRH